MKEIKLTQGQVALVDDEDFERVNQFKWFAHNTGYAFRAVRNIRVNGKRQTQTLHGFIMGDNPLKLDIDHANLIPLDCQKHNLRFCTQSQNCANRGPFKKGSSKYKGVSFVPHINKYVSRIQKDKKLLILGYYIDEVEAAKAYDRKAKELFGQFARVNFPEDWAGQRVLLKIGNKILSAEMATNFNLR